MKSSTCQRRLRLPGPESDGLAGEPWIESLMISPVRKFPALEGYLRDIHEPDAQPGWFRRH